MSRGQSGGYVTARCRRSSNRDRPRPYARKCTALKFKFPRGSGLPVRALKGKPGDQGSPGTPPLCVHCIPHDGVSGASRKNSALAG
jgi:hypothetical protein